MTDAGPNIPRGRRRAAARELTKLRSRGDRTPAHPILERAAGETSSDAMMSELLAWPMTMRRGWPDVDRLEHLLTEDEFLTVYRRNVEDRFLAGWGGGNNDDAADLREDFARAQRWMDAEDAAYDERFGDERHRRPDVKPPTAS